MALGTFSEKGVLFKINIQSPGIVQKFFESRIAEYLSQFEMELRKGSTGYFIYAPNDEILG